jgi:hypothetical protein
MRRNPRSLAHSQHVLEECGLGKGHSSDLERELYAQHHLIFVRIRKWKEGSFLRALFYIFNATRQECCKKDKPKATHRPTEPTKAIVVLCGGNLTHLSLSFAASLPCAQSCCSCYAAVDTPRRCRFAGRDLCACIEFTLDFALKAGNCLRSCCDNPLPCKVIKDSKTCLFLHNNYTNKILATLYQRNCLQNMQFLINQSKL